MKSIQGCPSRRMRNSRWATSISRSHLYINLSAYTKPCYISHEKGTLTNKGCQVPFPNLIQYNEDNKTKIGIQGMNYAT